MNTQTKTAATGNLQAILDEINALLGATGGINEARARKVRKAIDTMELDQMYYDHKGSDLGLARCEACLEILQARLAKISSE